MSNFSADSNLLLAISLLIALAVAGLMYASWRIYQESPPTERDYMDPLPLRIRIVWPLIGLISMWLERLLDVETVESVRTKLLRSGLFYLYTPYEFISLQVVTGLLFLIGGAVFLNLTNLPFFPWIIAIPALGFWLPRISMSDLSKKRRKEIVRMLPTYIDFITMSVEAGLSLGGAFAQAVNKGPPGLLRLEFERVTRDVKAGAGRVEALQAMAERLDIREVTTLVNAIAMAERTGASIGQALRIQADQRLIERFQRAEKLAMEAPVKIIFPLVAFIFPSTFIVIGFPLAMKVLHNV